MEEDIMISNALRECIFVYKDTDAVCDARK